MIRFAFALFSPTNDIYDQSKDQIMTKIALMFGSIGVLVETSDLQRRAYNQAMSEAGLDWQWDEETYADLLTQTGGKERLAHLVAATGANLSPEAIDGIHSRKTEIAGALMASEGVALRPGVAELAQVAKARGMKLAFVTTTNQPNIDAVFAAAGNALSPSDFDHIASRDHIARGKPAPDAYLAALEALGVAPHDALAIEDTALSVMAAKRAGIEVVATPGAITANQDFWQADLVVGHLGQGGDVDPRVLSMLE